MKMNKNLSTEEMLQTVIFGVHAATDMPLEDISDEVTEIFYLWLNEERARAIEGVAGQYPVSIRDMVSRGSVRDWLLARAEERRNAG
jgi:hypothetical protein